MGDINEIITVEAAGAIAQLDEFAAAAERAAAKFQAAQDKIKSGFTSAGGAGADKLAASMDKAAASISAAVDKINASLGKIGASADSAAAGIERLDEAAATAEESLTAAAAGADEAAAASDRLAASADAAGSALDREALAGERAGKSSAKAAEAGAAGWMKAGKVAAISIGVAAAYGIDRAMKLQAEVTRLYTAAGLQGVKPSDVTAATLRIGTQTGFSGQAIAEAMYHPVSAGLDWKTAQGLTTQAANLANIHGASLEDTAYSLSSVMKAYNKGAKEVIPTAALLNSIVGQGDMRFQDFNESIKNWAPTGASMGISMQSMGAGLAYLTDRGNSAEVASTRMTMGLSMATAGSKAANVYLRDLGLTTGNLELKNKSLQKTMEAGGLTTNKFAADLKKPDGLFVALTDMQGAFTKAGLSKDQADQVMAKIFGGGRSDKAIVSLMQNLGGLKQKYDQIGQGVGGYQSSVDKEQATAAQKWANFKAGMGNLATGFGNTLLPVFTSLAGEADKFLSFLQGSKAASAGLVAGLGGLAALFTGKKLVSGVESTFKTAEAGLRGIGKISEVLKIPGLDKLANIGKGSAAGQMAGAADANVRAGGLMLDASGNMVRAAEMMAGEGGLGGTAGKGAAATEGAAAAEAGGAGGILAALRAAAGPVGLGVLAGSIIKAIGDTIAPAGSTAGKYNAMLQKTPATNQSSLMPSIFGGFEGKLMGSIGESVGGAINNAIHFASGGAAASPIQQARRARMAQSFAPVASAPAKVPAPDLSALKAAQATVQGDMNKINTIIASAKAAKLPAPDMSALNQAKAKVQGDLNAINAVLNTALSKPAKMASPELSALAGAKATAAQHAAGIHAAAETPIQKPVKMASPDLSALAAAKGKAAADGAALDAGLASGILANQGQVVAAASQVAAAATAAMHVTVQAHSPSRVTYRTGQDVGTGYELGIKSKVHAVKAAAKQLSEAAVQSLQQNLLGGKSAVDAVMTALGKGPRPQDITTIDASAQKLISQVPKGHSALVAMLKADNAELDRLAAKRAVLMQEITNAQQITTSTISGQSIMGALNAQPASAQEPVSGVAVVQGMQYQAGNLKQFAAQVAQLKKMGLNATSLDQIIQAGPDQGLQIAQALTSGGAGTIGQVNQLEGSIIKSSGQVGNVGGPAMYQAGVDAANAAAKGLRSQLGTIENIMRQISNEMVSALQSVLGKHGPGGSAHHAAPHHAAARHVAPVHSASHGGREPAVVHHHHTTINVQGSVTSEHELVAVVQNHVLERSAQNWNTGWRYPGRAA